nr:hypothetical protein [uncultured Marinifilum sp.]
MKLNKTQIQFVDLFFNRCLKAYPHSCAYLKYARYPQTILDIEYPERQMIFDHLLDEGLIEGSYEHPSYFRLTKLGFKYKSYQIYLEHTIKSIQKPILNVDEDLNVYALYREVNKDEYYFVSVKQIEKYHGMDDIIFSCFQTKFDEENSSIRIIDNIPLLIPEKNLRCCLLQRNHPTKPIFSFIFR